MLAQKGVLLISPLPNNPKFFSCKSSFHGQVIQADSPKFEECKLHSKRRNLGVWRDGRGQKKMKENGDQMDELRCLSNYSDTSDLESGQVNITQNQVNGEVKRHLDHQQKIQ